MRKDLDSNEEVINILCQTSPALITHASQEDKIDVHKQLTEVTDQWEALENNWSKRKSELEQVYELAVQFQTELEAVEVWLTNEENTFANMPPIGTKLDMVKRQLSEMRVSFYIEK